MASSSTLGEIEKRFFECSLCLESLNDPKALPCLHRYCRKCMKTVLADKQGSFNCPLCNEEFDVPQEGVDGFRTDFFVKSVLEFIQLQEAYKEDNTKRCHGCKKTKHVNSYCFKCKDFLCQQCYQFHLDNDMLEEHRPHILDLQNVDVMGMTLEKLTSLTEDPRCAVHVKRTAEMCCETCDNLPICVACVFGKHKGHATHEVQILAKSVEEKLEAVMSKLDGCRDKLHELPKRITKVREALAANIKKQLEDARSMHKDKSERIVKKAEQDRGALEKQRKDILKRHEEECDQVRREQKEEIKKLRKKYKNILKGKWRSCQKEVGKVDRQTGMINDELSTKIDNLKQELHSYEAKVEASRVNNEEGITDVDDYSRHRIDRYENFTATATTVQASHDEWTKAQCLPAITAAGETLIKDVKKESGDLESLSKTGVGYVLKKVKITDNHESVVDIKGFEEGYIVNGITSSSAGCIIVTGRVGKSHITVINRGGRVVRQHQIHGGEAGKPFRYCHSLSQHITATVCESNQVGLYDIRTGEYVSKAIGDMHINWPGCASSIATDAQNNIYVGGNKGVVLVLDGELNYCRTIELPQIIRSAGDIAVLDSHLIVCDWVGKRSYAVIMLEKEAEVAFEFTRPDGGHCPFSVCTDSYQYVYMLWVGSGGHTILTQYSQDGRQLLATRKAARDALCLTTLGEEEEKLVIVTDTSGKLYTFGLLEG